MGCKWNWSDKTREKTYDVPHFLYQDTSSVFMTPQHKVKWQWMEKPMHYQRRRWHLSHFIWQIPTVYGNTLHHVVGPWHYSSMIGTQTDKVRCFDPTITWQECFPHQKCFKYDSGTNKTCCAWFTQEEKCRLWLVTRKTPSRVRCLILPMPSTPVSCSHNSRTLDGPLYTVYIQPYTPSVSILLHLLYLLHLYVFTLIIIFRHINPNPAVTLLYKSQNVAMPPKTYHPPPPKLMLLWILYS
jgi:hypothetical protein